MKKINCENLPSQNTPINAENLNEMQYNIEEEINNVSAKTTNIWSGNLYETGSDKTELTSEAFEEGKLYMFVVQGLSGSFKMTIPYIHGSGNSVQHSYYDGETVVRWRIIINTSGTGFYLDEASKNMGSNTGITEVYRVD